MQSAWSTTRIGAVVVVAIGVSMAFVSWKEKQAVPDHPFTTDEIYAALRLMGVSEDEARDAAADAVTPTAPQDTSEPELPPGALKFYNAPSVQFMGDFLAALSLVSPSVEKKVREYRDSLRADPTEDQEWEKRRDELRRMLRRKGR